MPAWLLKAFHRIGLTNLTDEQVRLYGEMKKRAKVSLTDAPIVKTKRPKVATIESTRLCVTLAIHE